MNFEEITNDFTGTWTGESILYLSWLPSPEFHSPSELTAASVVRDKFLTFSYTWEHENTAHEGLLLVGYDSEQEIFNGAWVDSWHSNVKPLILSGKVDERGAIDLRGNYEVPNHPDWGWRIVAGTSEGNLRIKMYNITPEGEEDLAVQSDYKRLLREAGVNKENR